MVATLKNRFEAVPYHEVLVEPVLHDDELLEVLDLDCARTLEVATIRVVLLGRAEIRIVKIATALELTIKQNQNLTV